MQSFHCETFELRARFRPQEINVEELLKELQEHGISTDPDEAGDRKLSIAFREESEEEDSFHAHLNMRVWRDGNGRIDLGYHAGRLQEIAIARPPTAGNCAKWLGKFFDKPARAYIHVHYTFDKSFVPVVSLPFPLVTSEKDLAGALVSGLSLLLPNESRTAIIQTATEETYLFIRNQAVLKINLKDFSLFSELDKLSGLVNKLVKES